jgi:hypothetical protein
MRERSVWTFRKKLLPPSWREESGSDRCWSNSQDHPTKELTMGGNLRILVGWFSHLLPSWITFSHPEDGGSTFLVVSEQTLLRGVKPPKRPSFKEQPPWKPQNFHKILLWRPCCSEQRNNVVIAGRIKTAVFKNSQRATKFWDIHRPS